MTGSTRGTFGQEVIRRREPGTVLVRSGGRAYAVLHVEATPLRIWPPDASWTAFSLDLVHGGSRFNARQFALLRRDPRIVLVPVDAPVADSLGTRSYEPATDAAAFAEAVIIGGEEAYYGECAFRLSAENPGYVEMERSTFRRLLGDFAPRKGDLAFTRTGLFLGVMVNSDHCLLLTDLEMFPPFRCGERLDPAANSAILRGAQATLERLPFALR